MTRDSQVMAATIAGAVVGGMVGYLFFTDQGRHTRRSIELALEDISRELTSFRSTIQRAADVAAESWKLLNDVFVEAQRPLPRYPSAHQSSPF